jgi:hypothetical protein
MTENRPKNDQNSLRNVFTVYVYATPTYTGNVRVRGVRTRTRRTRTPQPWLPEEEELDDDEANDNTSGRSEPAPYIVPPEYDALGAPTKLDKSLVGNFIFQKWNVDGWCLGKITHFYQRGVLIPGQSERGNYGVSWVGDPRGTMRDSRLSLENYFAATIADTLSEAGTKGIGSWVLLKRKKK